MTLVVQPPVPPLEPAGGPAGLVSTAARLLKAGGWTWDAATGVLRTSHGFGVVFGCDDESPLVLADPLALVPEPQRSIFRMSVQHALATGEPFDLTTALAGSDGRDRQLRYVGEAVRDTAGRIVAVSGAVQDVTSLAALGSAQDRLEEQLRARLDQMATGIGFLDADWRFTYVNETGIRYLQLPASVLIGGNLWEVFPELEGTAFAAAYRRAMQDRVVVSARDFYAPWGRWILATGYPVGDGIAFHLQDVTEDQRNIDRLQESTARVTAQAALLDAARDAMNVRSLDGVVHYWNAGAERVYGWPAEQALGRSVRELLIADRAAFDAALEETRRSGHWTGELEMRTRDGRAILVDCRWQLTRDDHGRATAVFAVESDITEVRKAEEERYRAQRIESLGVLAGGMAHDLNNVLTPILLSAQLLAADRPEPAAAELLASIESSARRGADLIRQVLLFARGEETRRRVLSVDTLLAELDGFCRKTVPKSIDVSFRTPTSPLHVTADRTQLMQVLVNLVMNACDAMPDGGILTIRAEELAGRRREVALTVEDTGEGMDAEVRARIFEPFFSTKAPGRGTGLGLSTSLAIARRHDGVLEVASSPGSGSRFTLRLPGAAADADLADEIPSDDGATAGRGRLVLVVDDDAPVREAVSRVLSASGYRTVAAGDGRAALEALEASDGNGEPVGAVVVDLLMPALGGEAVLERLRTERPSLPVVVISGYDPEGGEETRLHRDSVRFLRKPFGDAELLCMLSDLLARAELRS